MPSPTRYLDKAGTLGTIAAAMGCASCFPALGSLAAALGLGFLASHEGVLINRILPALVLFALVLNSYLWGRNGRHIRGLLSIIGPLAVLLTLYPLWSYGWSTYLLYAGLALMLAMSIVELIKPTHAICVPQGVQR